MSAILTALTLLLPPSVLPSTGQEPAGEDVYYTCPPCGCPGDTTQYEAPGACPHCEMALTPKRRGVQQRQEVARSGSPAEPVDVAILIFPGVQIVDFTAPYEVFGQAGFRVFTVAESADPLTTSMGLEVVPRYTLENCPEPDVVMVPGGGVGAARTEPVLSWLKAQEPTADHILTVCNGAFILADTGLLDGLEATTYYGLISTLRQEKPAVNVVANLRYTDNGKIVTSAGLSSGLDGALHVVERMRGKAAAQRVALNMEYSWLDDVNYARAAFADRMLIDLGLLSGGHYPLLDAEGTRWKLESTRGSATAWSLEWTVEGGLQAADLLELLDAKLRTDCAWNRMQEPGPALGSTWAFTDPAGATWKAVVRVADGERKTVSLSVECPDETAG